MSEVNGITYYGEISGMTRRFKKIDIKDVPAGINSIRRENEIVKPLINDDLDR